ncbi:MAG: oxygenase MpaB family protein [Rubrivivax sp.]
MPAEHWTDAVLDAARLEMDPAADAVVRAVYDAGAVDAVNVLLMNTRRPSSELPLPVPPAVESVVRDYLRDTAVLPYWAEPARIRQAEHLFSRHGLLASVILCCASLPECYLDALDVPVLASTTQLSDHVYRRILETSSMVVAVMQPGGMAPGGVGMDHSQRVRLMHAAVRHLILSRGRVGQALPPPIPQRGRPINQESMAFVILTFSWVGLRSMERLEIDVSDDEREAYVHAWSVIGHVMGVRDDLLAHSVDEARLLFERIKARRRGASPEGKALTAALLGWMEGEMPRLLRRVPGEMMERLMDPDDLLLLGVDHGERNAADRLFDGLLHSVEKVVEGLEALPLGRRAAEAMFSHIVKAVWDSEKVWMAEAFALPPSLRQSWSLPQGVR